MTVLGGVTTEKGWVTRIRGNIPRGHRVPGREDS